MKHVVGMPAALTLQAMPAQGLGATGQDRSPRTPLGRAQGVRGQVRSSEAAQHLRQPHHGRADSVQLG